LVATEESGGSEEDGYKNFPVEKEKGSTDRGGLNPLRSPEPEESSGRQEKDFADHVGIVSSEGELWKKK